MPAAYTPKSGALAGQAFASEGRYRAALARERGFTSHRQLLNVQARERGYASREASLAASRPIRTRGQFSRLTVRQADTRGRALDALSQMRRNPHLSLTRAAQDAETTPGAVRRYAGTSLTKERGRVRTTKSDRLYRPMKVAIDTPGMSRGGALGGEVRSIGISSSRTATAVGRHWSALQRYLHHGDYAALAKYRGRTFTADGVTYTFLTDRDKIAELADLGIFDHITDIYSNAV